MKLSSTFRESEKLLTSYFCTLVQEVIQAAVADVMENNAHLKYVRLMDGYRRFDPTRGMDYKLHLLFHDPIEGEIIQRLIHFTNRYKTWVLT